MTHEEIQQLADQGVVERSSEKASYQLFETHISWVFVGEQYAYKIKKPLSFSFLDFSTLQKRKYYCEREVELNNRQTKGVYINVCPVIQNNGRIVIDEKNRDAEALDYAVKMVSLATGKRMDKMLRTGQVTESHIHSVAEALAPFHINTVTVHKGDEAEKMQIIFNDILNQQDYLVDAIGNEAGYIIDEALTVSDHFLKRFGWLLRERDQDGYVKDCHGDLHSGNIFLYDQPVIFDCIEFNDEFRQIDVLDEIAFFCMDLEFAGRQDFSQLFLRHYLTLYPCMTGSKEEKLFRYYKLHRANIKAKVSAIKAQQAETASEQKERLDKAKAYLNLMQSYAQKL